MDFTQRANCSSLSIYSVVFAENRMFVSVGIGLVAADSRTYPKGGIEQIVVASRTFPRGGIELTAGRVRGMPVSNEAAKCPCPIYDKIVPTSLALHGNNTYIDRQHRDNTRCIYCYNVMLRDSESLLCPMWVGFIAERQAASVSERSQAIDHCLFEPRRYISDICITRHVTAHMTASRDGSSFQGVLLLLFSRSSLPACSRGSGAQESRWEWQRRGCVQHAEGATLQDGARDLIRRQWAKIGQTRIECGRMAQGYWRWRRTSSGSPGLRSLGSNKQGPWLLRQLQSVTSQYTCLLAT